MDSRRVIIPLLAVTLAVCFASVAWAGLFSGEIVSVSSDGSAITVKSKDGSKQQTFKVPGSAEIKVDGKNVKLDKLTSGQQVSVFTDAKDAVTRVTVRTDAGAAKPAADTEKPMKKTTVKKPAGRKDRTVSAGNAAAGSWPQFLGPNRDNLSAETGLLKKWPSSGPPQHKLITGLGVGFSNLAIEDGVVYTMGNVGEREFAFAFNLESGEKIWEFDNASAYHNGFGDGPRGTPTLDGDFVYVLGGGGDLACLDRKSGQSSWKKNITREFGSGVPGWGICESVLIDGDHLVCTPGGNGAVLVKLDKKTGEVVWKAATPNGDRTGYASMIAVDVGGVKQYVQFMAGGVIGIRADDGQYLWRDDSSANGTANCCAPVFDDNMVFTASGYGKGASMVQLASRGKETAARFGYHTNDLKVHHGGLVLVNGHVYGTNDPGILTCVELKTGKTKWQNRSVGKGSVTFADGNLVVRSEGGPVALVQASPGAYNELGKFNQPDRSRSPAWTYPVVCDGKLFLRDQDKLFIYDVKGK